MWPLPKRLRYLCWCNITLLMTAILTHYCIRSLVFARLIFLQSCICLTDLPTALYLPDWSPYSLVFPWLISQDMRSIKFELSIKFVFSCTLYFYVCFSLGYSLWHSVYFVGLIFCLYFFLSFFFFLIFSLLLLILCPPLCYFLVFSLWMSFIVNI